MHSYQLIGASAAVREIQQELEYVARTDAKVLITGESGVGKEVVARLIHQRSRRSHAQLVALNCAGLPDTLLETELFGHMRGSFSDAYRDKRGLLEIAHGGTLFMDEIGDMSLRMQALLLRFLETGEVRRVGSEGVSATTDVRIIVATNRNLRRAIADRTFREDVYYRINVVHFFIPPLRERVEDIEPLLDYYVRRYAAAHHIQVPELTPEARSFLLAYRWPGNVRELKNVVERVIVRVRNNIVHLGDLPPEMLTGRYPTAQEAGLPPTVAQAMYDQMVCNGQSFWAVVHDPFMLRDITREDLRQVVLRGLEHTQGSYESLVRLFNMVPQDYKRFLNFLRKCQCQMPFQRFRAGYVAPAASSEDERPVAPARMEGN